MSLSNPVITLSPGASVSVPVTIVAPTETVSFAINDLPFGVSESYKESESNPSGLLTLTANASAAPGTYKPTIIIGSSGRTASLTFALQVVAAKAVLWKSLSSPRLNQASYYQQLTIAGN